MGKIIKLDDKTIQKIAAGEVVERPASIIKELVENSLDANSSNIIIEVRNGGKTYIRVTDDGNGIEEDDLDLAFERHSTSKLSLVEDLHRIRSLGFRGEALASISHVSRVEVMTKTDNVLAGIHGVVEEGKIISKEIVGCPKGTTIIAKDLFYNIPVRKEFLKSDLVELNQISDIVYKIALGNLKTSFKFIKDDKVVLKTSRHNDMKSHIYSILGKEFSNNLTEINLEENGIILKGYISNNNLYRGSRNHQYIYVNGRYIMSTSISNLIESHYKSIIPLNRFPVFIIFIDVDPASIDVNIHPTKQEIKFSNQSNVLAIIDKCIKNALFPSLSIPKVSFNQKNKKPDEENLPLLFNESYGDLTDNIVIKDFTKESLYSEYKGELTQLTNKRVNEQLPIIDNMKFIDDRNDSSKEELDVNKNNNDIEDVLSTIEPLGVIFNTYILAEDRVKERIYFIDQHAAHERVMYENYLKEFKSENIAAQQLIVPEVFELTNFEMNNLLENNMIFKDLGFDIQEFGNNSVAIRAVPLLFGIPNVRDLFFDLLDNMNNNNIINSYETKIEKVMKLACVNAVKSGDHMSKIEIQSLLVQLKKCENPHSCPHGRPTILEMSKNDIEKAFLRIM